MFCCVLWCGWISLLAKQNNFFFMLFMHQQTLKTWIIGDKNIHKKSVRERTLSKTSRRRRRRSHQHHPKPFDWGVGVDDCVYLSIFHLLLMVNVNHHNAPPLCMHTSAQIHSHVHRHTHTYRNVTTLIYFASGFHLWASLYLVRGFFRLSAVRIF